MMRNPYEVLGLDSTAKMDDVKRAYRELAQQYNEDYKKMDELNAAYDAIVMNFGNAGRKTSYADTTAQYSYNSDPTDGVSEYGDIRAKLNSGRIDDAEMLLDGIPHQRRNAEWYYIKGTIQHRRGWLESAAESFEKAHELEPDNNEYQAAYRQLHKEKKGAFRQERQQSDNSGCGDPCKICTGLCCADCCCECMGGDLIRCC
ncbi:MAG: DnaJ domain-containing protein [Clostridia bacterium]|nr:DnaJ domain-containing protein [Clostridia bacterium]